MHTADIVINVWKCSQNVLKDYLVQEVYTKKIVFWNQTKFKDFKK